MFIVGFVIIWTTLSQNRRYRIGILDIHSRRVIMIYFLSIKRSIFVFILNVKQDIVCLPARLKPNVSKLYLRDRNLTSQIREFQST